MDTHTLRQQFHNVVSLASLAYIFSGIHAIQYSLLDHNMDDYDIEDHTVANLQQNAWTSHSDFTSTHDTFNPPNTSTSNSGKINECWMDQEITLLCQGTLPFQHIERDQLEENTIQQSSRHSQDERCFAMPLQVGSRTYTYYY